LGEGLRRILLKKEEAKKKKRSKVEEREYKEFLRLKEKYG
jgi:hypothetical protein